MLTEKRCLTPMISATSIATFAFLAAFVGVAEAAAPASSGKYCIDKNSTMLLVRPGANGALEFGMSFWTGRGHFFGVSGLAQPEQGRWRYREDMSAADPDDRCEVLLAREPDGGYSFSVTKAGACRSKGGAGAGLAPNDKWIFPARSRRGDMPPNKPMAEAISLESGGISCDTR